MRPYEEDPLLPFDEMSAPVTPPPRAEPAEPAAPQPLTPTEIESSPTDTDATTEFESSPPASPEHEVLLPLAMPEASPESAGA